MGQKLGELVAYIAAVCLGAEDLNVVGKLSQELTTCTAGSGPVFAVGIDGQTLELSVAFKLYKYGYGNAMGVILAIIIAILSAVQFKMGQEK